MPKVKEFLNIREKISFIFQFFEIKVMFALVWFVEFFKKMIFVEISFFFQNLGCIFIMLCLKMNRNVSFEFFVALSVRKDR